MSKQDSVTYAALLSRAKQFDYYATCPTNGLSASSREYWANEADNLRAQAEAMPDDFVDPEFRMPDWGTRGT